MPRGGLARLVEEDEARVGESTVRTLVGPRLRTDIGDNGLAKRAV